MEKCDHSLSQFVPNHFSSLKIQQKVDLALQMSQGLMYVHDNKNLIHKDVKPNNFLLNIINEDKIVVKLTDLGFSKRLMDLPSKITSKSDNDALTWIAPELFSPPYHFLSASDVWAFGCVIYFLFSGGKHPFDAPSASKKNLSERRASKKNFNLLALEQNENTDQITADIHQRLRALIVTMIDNEPNNRPTIKEVTNQLRQLCNWENQALNNGLNEFNQPRKVGQIEYNDSKVLGEGSQSTSVFEGTFFSVGAFKKITARPCAVKRTIKDKGGEEIDENNKKKKEEIKTLIKLSQHDGISTTNLPIIRCYGFEENDDFWYN